MNLRKFQEYIFGLLSISMPEKIPADFKEDFILYCMGKTLSRLMVLSVFIVPLQILQVLWFALSEEAGALYLYIAVSVFYILLLFLCNRLVPRVKDKTDNNIFFSELTVVVFLCVIISGEMFNFFMYMSTELAEFQLMIIVSVIALASVFKTKRLMAVSGAMYALAAIIIFLKIEGAALDALHFILIFAAAAVMEWVCFFSRIDLADMFMSQKVLQNTNLKLEEANLKLLEMNEALERLSETDQLTKLANRRAFDEYIAKTWNECRRLGQPMAVMMIDIDHFKAFNDFYGHVEGDDCLRAVADAIRARFNRRSDIAARYGGEEFVVVLPYCKKEALADFAERMRKDIEDLKIPNPKSRSGHYITISIGVACRLPGPDSDGFQTAERIVQLADKALYSAKNSGRNRVVMDLYEDDSPAPG